MQGLNKRRDNQKSERRVQQRQRVLWHDWLFIDLAAGVLLIAAVFLVSVFGYGMRFPKLQITSNVLQNVILILLLLPFPVGVFGLSARQTGKRARARFLTFLSFPVLLAAVVSAAIMFFLPPLCSSTSNTKNYLKFDALTSDAADSISMLFPAALPSSAQSVNYRYFKYTSVLEDTVNVTAGITLDEAQYNEEKARILSLKQLESAAVSESAGITLIDKAADASGGTEMHVTLDDNYRRIIYTAGYRKLR